MSAESTTPTEPAAALGRVRDLAERFEAYGMTIPTWKLRAAIDGRPGIPPAPSPAPSSDELMRVFEDGRIDCWNTPDHGGLADCCDRVGLEAVRSLIATALAAHEAEVFRLREVLAAARGEIKASSDADTALILTSCTCDWNGEGSIPHRPWCNWVLATTAAEDPS